MTKKGVLRQPTSTCTETFSVKCLALKRLKSAFHVSLPGIKQYTDSVLKPHSFSTNRHWQILTTQLISFFVFCHPGNRTWCNIRYKTSGMTSIFVPDAFQTQDLKEHVCPDSYLPWLR